MDSAEIFGKVGILCLLLAIFTIGLSYIPAARLYYAFFRRKPTPKGIAMMRKYLGLLAIVTIPFIIWAAGSLACNLAFGEAKSIVSAFGSYQPFLCHPILFRNIIGIAILLVVILVIWLFIRTIRRVANIITDKEVETDTERMVKRLDKLISLLEKRERHKISKPAQKRKKRIRKQTSK